MHNPYALDFMRRHGSLGRELNDIPCGGHPSYAELRAALPSLRSGGLESSRVHGFYRLVGHVQQLHFHPNGEDALDRRVRFMRSQMDEDSFRRSLTRHERQVEKMRDIRMV